MPQAPLDRLKRLSRIMAGFTLALIVLLFVAGVFQTNIRVSLRTPHFSPTQRSSPSSLLDG